MRKLLILALLVGLGLASCRAYASKATSSFSGQGTAAVQATIADPDP
jgi:hypothetical protein